MLHKYRIEKRIGSGAFANVYQAYDTIEGRRVAVKDFQPQSDVSEPAFRHEARMIARLDHENIVRLKSAEIIGRHMILVTELGEQTLADIMDRKRSPNFALKVLDQVLHGLAYAHRQGVIHRDIKPENILIWRDGRVKITDFGISRLVESPVTHTTATGTPSYRAPEQAYGRPTFASDVFAAALMFYELNTLVLPRWPFRWPFERHQAFESRVSTKLANVIRRASNFDLTHRYRDAGAMLKAVRAAVPELRNGDTKVTLTQSPPKRLSWREYRMREFEKRYEKHLQLNFRCNECSGPVSEFMKACPWCGFAKNSFDGITTFPSVCVRCEHGVHDDWNYCAWCYGAGFTTVSHVPSRDERYSSRRCTRCHETRLMPHMSYCPWCNSRLRPWRSRQLHDRCPSCQNSVAGDHWDYCAWCAKPLSTSIVRTNGRRSGR